MGLVDQGLSSLTNFCAVVVAASLLSVEGFGYYSIAYIIYVMVLQGTQSLLSQELVLRPEDDSSASSVHALRRAMGIGIAAAGILTAAAVLVIPTSFMPPFSILAVGLPALLAQDVLRTVAARTHMPQIAAVSDGTWLFGFLAAALYLSSNTLAGPASVMFAWVASGVLSLIVGLLLLGPSKFRHHWRSRASAPLWSRDFLGWRFLLESFLTRSASQVSMLLLGGVAGVAATGAMRGAASLYGPIGVAINTVPVLAVPPMRRLASGTYHLALLGAAIVIGVLPIAFCLAILALPDAVGERLLGETWLAASALVLPMGLQFAAIGVSTVAFTAIRLKNPKGTLAIKVVSSVVVVLSFWIGYALGGVSGAAWGLFSSSLFQASWATIYYLRRRKTWDTSTPVSAERVSAISSNSPRTD